MREKSFMSQGNPGNLTMKGNIEKSLPKLCSDYILNLYKCIDYILCVAISYILGTEKYFRIIFQRRFVEEIFAPMEPWCSDVSYSWILTVMVNVTPWVTQDAFIVLSHFHEISFYDQVRTFKVHQNTWRVMRRETVFVMVAISSPCPAFFFDIDANKLLLPLQSARAAAWASGQRVLVIILSTW